MNLSITLNNGDVIQRKLLGLANACSNMRPAFKDVGELLVKDYKENIDEQGRKLDTKWALRLWNYPHPPLRKTGKLQSGFKITKMDKFEVEVSNPVEYAKYHQYGTKGHGPKTASMLRFETGGKIIYAKYVRGITARKIIGLGRILIQDIFEIFNRYLNDKIR